MSNRQRSDAGQAFPIYIVMVAGLLFLAFAFFAVGKASATRNGAQGAADAAALAAAQEARDQLGPDFLGALLRPGGLNDFLTGHNISSGVSCGEAQRFAAENRADVVGCAWGSGFQRDEVTVKVKTRNTVGDTVIPGTEDKHANATATAVIEFRCRWKQSDAPDKGTGPGSDKDKSGKEEVSAPFTFDCDGGSRFDIDPLHPGSWTGLDKALFAVHLIDD